MKLGFGGFLILTAIGGFIRGAYIIDPGLGIMSLSVFVFVFGVILIDSE